MILYNKIKRENLEPYDLAVIGSGIGGSLTAALNSHQNTILFEKDKNLGGCAGTFKRFGNYYNVGATTLVGYEDNHLIKDFFNKLNIKPNITQSEIAIRVVQNGKSIDRIKNFEEFLESIEKLYPNKNNRLFWGKIKQLDEKFWKLQKIYYARHSFSQYIKTAAFISELIKVFKFDLYKTADFFIQQTLGDISKEYQQFIDAQLLITVQAKSHDISLLSLALGLAYPFHDVFYVNGGMGSLIESIVKQVDIHRNEEIIKIKKDGQSWAISSNKEQYKAKKIVLNSSVYQSGVLFEDKKIQNYYNSFLLNDQSAFVLYLNLKSELDFLEHYQLIFDDNFSNCISNSCFISFSKKSDKKLSSNGYSITISTHTKANFWRYLPKVKYNELKAKTEQELIEKFLEYFNKVKKEDIIQSFSATSFTFNRYINRYNCGGKVVNFKNILKLPSHTTPFKSLYNVGDTIFSGQGWPGVALGVDILNKELNL